MRKGLSLFSFCIVVFLGHFSMAQVDKSYVRMQAGLMNFAGEKYTSLADSAPGTTFELSRVSSGSFFAGYAKARGTNLSGSQKFADEGGGVKATSTGGTVTSSFTYYSGQAEVGFQLYPIRRTKGGINVFLGAGGVMSYHYIKLETAGNYTPISDSVTTYGYATSVGAEWILTQGGFSLNGEISFRSDAGKFLDISPFRLGGLAMTLGFGWGLR